MSKTTRPLRAEKAFDDEKYFSESGDEDNDDGYDEVEDDDVEMEDAEEDLEDSDEGSEDLEPDDPTSNIQITLRTVDFGTLTQAQSSLARDRQHIHPSRLNASSNSQSATTTRTDAEKVNTLRARLAELKTLKSGGSSKTDVDNVKENRTSNDPTRSTQSSRSKSGTITLHTRTHKHAPTEQSSKYQVSRRRTTTDLSSNPTHARDPRFTTTASAPDVEMTKKKYAFLADYRATELQDLKSDLSAIKARAQKRKSRAMLPEEEVTATRLRVAINRLENRAKAEVDKERARDVVRKHKKEEREQVAQGKKPFYLKESEVRKRALTEKFEGMKAKERDRALKRRQKKISERERRSMPGGRRGAQEE